MLLCRRFFALVLIQMIGLFLCFHDPNSIASVLNNDRVPMIGNVHDLLINKLLCFSLILNISVFEPVQAVQNFPTLISLSGQLSAVDDGQVFDLRSNVVKSGSCQTAQITAAKKISSTR